jgi:anaerobic dimethyl sulfoxide reductase subunit B
MKMQIAFYFDQNLCTGCDVCIVACKNWHDVPPGPASWRRVTTIEKGTYPDVFLAFLATSCYHCANPACITACPANAITKRQTDGVVVVDRDSCIGKDAWGFCKEACPYDAPQFGAENDARMQICNFCYDDRLLKGKPPICVAACPMRALDFGPIDELEKKYDKPGDAEGFVYSQELCPSIIIKPKKSNIESNVKITVSPNAAALK